MAGASDRRFRPGLWLTAFTLPALAALVGLGVWQLDRREWKHELIARLEERLAAEPAPLPGPGDDAAAAEFRRVRLEGRLLHDRAQLLVGRSYQGQTGYEVMTPLLLPDGRHVFVDRGWIPVSARDAALREARPSPDAAAVEGVMRRPPAGAAAGASRGNEHYRLDLAYMAAQAGLDPKDGAPVYVIATGQAEPGRLPVPRAAAVELPDNHLQYALTWFALAGALAVISIVAARRR